MLEISDDEAYVRSLVVDCAPTSCCLSCKGPLMTPCDDSIPSCQQCGWTSTYTIDTKPEWKTIRTDDSRGVTNVRCSAPQHPLYFNQTPFCKMQWNGGAVGSVRPKRWKGATSSNGNKEKNFYTHCMVFTQIGFIYNIKKIMIDRACWWFRELTQYQHFHGIASDALKAACLYISFREYSVPRTPKEVATIMSAKKKDVTKCINLIEEYRNSIMNDDGSTITDPQKAYQRQVRIANLMVPKTILKESAAADYLPRILCQLPIIDSTIALLCEFICQKIEYYQLIVDNYPRSIAVTVIFFLSECLSLGITKKELCSLTSDISEVTINRCYNKMITYYDILIPTQFQNKRSSGSTSSKKRKHFD